MLSSSHLYVPVISSSLNAIPRNGSNIIVGPSAPSLRNNEISIENLDQMNINYEQSYPMAAHGSFNVHEPAEVVLHHPRVPSPSGHSTLTPHHVNSRRNSSSTYSSTYRSRSNSNLDLSASGDHLSQPSSIPNSTYASFSDANYLAVPQNNSFDSQNQGPVSQKRGKTQSNTRRRRANAEEESENESYTPTSGNHSRPSTSQNNSPPTKNNSKTLELEFVDTNDNGNKSGDSEIDDDEDVDDATQKRRHRESETRRRGRLRDQFQQLNDLVKCPKKTRAQILNSAVSQLQQYKERIRQLEAQIEAKQTHETKNQSSMPLKNGQAYNEMSGGSIDHNGRGQKNQRQQREVVLNDSDMARGVGRFKGTYNSLPLVQPLKRTRPTADDYNSEYDGNDGENETEYNQHSEQNGKGFYRSGGSTYDRYPHGDMSMASITASLASMQTMSTLPMPMPYPVGTSDVTRISVVPVITLPNGPPITAPIPTNLNLDPSEINRLEPRDPTMAAVVSALRDQLSPLVSLTMAPSSSAVTSSSNSSQTLLEGGNNPLSHDSLLSPIPSTMQSFSQNQLAVSPFSRSPLNSSPSSRSVTPMLNLSRSHSSHSTHSQSQAYVRPPCMPCDAKATDMPPCMKGPNANTLKARTCLITGAPACTPALLSIHHPLISNVAICLIGLDSRFVDCNLEYERVAGTSREGLNKMNMFERTHPDELYRVMGIFRKMLDGSVSVWESYRRFLTDEPGVYRTVKFTLTSVKVAGHPLFFVGFCLPEDASHVEPIPGVTGLSDDISSNEQDSGCIYYRPPTPPMEDRALEHQQPPQRRLQAEISEMMTEMQATTPRGLQLQLQIATDMTDGSSSSSSNQTAMDIRVDMSVQAPILMNSNPMTTPVSSDVEFMGSSASRDALPQSSTLLDISTPVAPTFDLGLDFSIVNGSLNNGMLQFPIHDYIDSLQDEEEQASQIQVFFNDIPSRTSNGTMASCGSSDHGCDCKPVNSLSTFDATNIANFF